MHGTGLLPAIATMVAGGSIVTLAHRSFDAREAIEAIERHRPQALVIVGDSFGRPLLAELEGGAQAHDLGSVLSVTSSGVMWSADIKRGLLRHMPDAVLSDVLSSSEALGLGASVMTRDCEVKTASFTLGERCRVFDETDRPVLAGSGASGGSRSARPTRSAITGTRRNRPRPSASSTACAIASPATGCASRRTDR